MDNVDNIETLKIAVVLPCYKVKAHIQGVVAAIGPEVSNIYLVDDCCRGYNWFCNLPLY